MGFEYKINEELATITTIANELLSITRAITGLVRNNDFLECFNGIIREINKSFPVVLDSFIPFTALDSEQAFEQGFDDCYETFKAGYLMEASKPRRYCDSVYDTYILMQKTKEAKSQFPILKRSFARLETLYDKWITNDAMLAMSIDGVLKLQNRLLNEIAEMKSKDVEDAYMVFSAAMGDFVGYLTLIQQNSENISVLVEPVPSIAAAANHN